MISIHIVLGYIRSPTFESIPSCESCCFSCMSILCILIGTAMHPVPGSYCMTLHCVSLHCFILLLFPIVSQLLYIYMTLKHLYGIAEYDIPHSSSNPGYHPDVFQAALTLLKQLQVAQASGACSEMGTQDMSHGKVFVKYYFWIVFLCDVSLKYVWFCPGLLYVPCVF